MTTATATRTILVVDDDADVLTYLRTVLEDGGYRPVCVDNGNDGLAHARRERPDLICLDIAMPEPTGVRVYRELRSDPDLATVPVVMITGVQKEFKEFIHHRKHVPPPDGYIAKPFDVQELLDLLDTILGPRR